MFRSKLFMTVLSSTAALMLLLAGCNESRVSLGQAYVAPATLRVHSEVTPKSNTVAELKHGDIVDIVDLQRRMVRIRTTKGVEGWVDSLQLLSPQQMDLVKQRRQKEATLPSEGTATAYEVLNVHIDPDRQSPAFAQIPEAGAVQVLGYQVVPKTTVLPRMPGIVISHSQGASRKQRKEQQSHAASFRLPPKPPPPKPPANWLELSAERIDGGDGDTSSTETATPQPKPGPPPKPVVMEDWTLIKTKNNDVGWVLTRNLLMAIPDEVAQYAEGKHIKAFFDLGTVNDELKGSKHDWLWATAGTAPPSDFDSWRVFIWNTRKHRYETSFRQRDLDGYFPITVEPPDPDSSIRMFQIITKDDDGEMRRRSYTFDGHLVHLAKTESCNPAETSQSQAASTLDTNDLASKAPKPSWFKRQWTNIKRRFSGH